VGSKETDMSEDGIKEFTKDQVRERLESIITSARMALEDLNGQIIFHHVEDIWADINELHESMDEGITPSQFGE